MNKKIIVLLFCLLTTIVGFGQVKKIVTDVYGDFETAVKVGNEAFVTISSKGEVLDTEINGNIYYNSSGKVSSIGGVNFYYNSSGKVSSIGGVNFYYNSSGKVSSIGGNNFHYNSNGKLSSGKTSFTHSGISFRVTGGN